MTKAWAVACCACMRTLGIDGKTLGQPSGKPISGGLLPFGLSEQFASFDTKEEADQAALAAGWTVRDEDGPNHRCPDCQPHYEETGQTGFMGVVVDRRGGYINLKTGELSCE